MVEQVPETAGHYSNLREHATAIEFSVNVLALVDLSRYRPSAASVTMAGIGPCSTELSSDHFDGLRFLNLDRTETACGFRDILRWKRAGSF
jgi:hypothetical protein